MLFIGIDNGISGFLAWGEGSKQGISFMGKEQVPTTETDGKTRIDFKLTVELLRKLLVDRDGDFTVVYEQAFARPGRGSFADYSTGHCDGVWHSIFSLLDLDVDRVKAATWQAQLLQNKKTKIDSKTASIAMAQLIASKEFLLKTKRSRTPDHNIADAVCLAIYGWKKWKQGQ